MKIHIAEERLADDVLILKLSLLLVLLIHESDTSHGCLPVFPLNYQLLICGVQSSNKAHERKLCSNYHRLDVGVRERMVSAVRHQTRRRNNICQHSVPNVKRTE